MKYRVLVVGFVFFLTVFAAGGFVHSALSLDIAIIRVTPTVFTINEVGQHFEAIVQVEDVAGLYGWQFRLKYNQEMLQIGSIKVEAPFETMWNESHNDEGACLVVGSLLGLQDPQDGGMIVSVITFTSLSTGVAPLDLYDTKLGNVDAQPIPHEVVDGVNDPSNTHDIAIPFVTSNPSGWVGVPRGTPIYVDVTLQNQGDFSENFNVYVYADIFSNVIGDEVLVGAKSVDLAQGATMSLQYVWDTTEAPYGSYVISAKADVVPGEIDITDNFVPEASFIGGICKPWVPHRVSMLEIMESAAAGVGAIVSFGVFAIFVFRALGTDYHLTSLKKLRVRISHALL